VANTIQVWLGGFPWQAQRAIHQLRLNRLTSMASNRTFIGGITSPICPHCGSEEEMAEHLLLSCPRQAADCQHDFRNSIDIKLYVFQNYMNLVEFLISSWHLPLHIGTAWRARLGNSYQCMLKVLCTVVRSFSDLPALVILHFCEWQHALQTKW